MSGIATGRIRSELPLIVVIGLLLLASVFARYSGISHGGWNNLFQFMAHPDRFAADIFLKGSGVVRSSALFPLIQALGLDFTDDRVGMAVNLGLHAIAIAAFYRLVRLLAPDLSPAAAALMVLLTVFLDNKVDSVRAGLIVNGTLSPSWVAQGLTPLFLLLAGMGAHLPAALVATVMTVMAFKGTWLPLLAAVMAALTAPGRRRQALAYLLPAAALAWTALHTVKPTGMGYDEWLQLTRLVIERDMEECTLTLQPWPAIVLLLGSIPVYWTLARRVESSDLRRLLLWLLVVALASNLWNEFYIAVGYEIFPRPVLVLLQPLRALSVYIMVFFTLLAISVFRSPHLSHVEKAALLVALALFRVDKINAAVFSPELQAAIVAGLGLMPRLVERLSRRSLERWPLLGPAYAWMAALPVAWLVVLALGVVVSRHVIDSPTLAAFNRQGYQHFHRWTYRWHGDERGFAAAMALADDHEDYPLLVIDRRGGHYEEALPANEAALKAQFRGERSHFAMTSLALYQEAIDRTNLAEGLEAAMNAGRAAGPEILAGFAARKARLLVPEAAESLLPGAAVERRFDGWVLLRP